MNLESISNTILDETSSPEALRAALDAFVSQCSAVTDIEPNPSFDAWAEDSLLENGVAINPQAAAHCAVDYQRSVIFIRGVYAAINALESRAFDIPLEILYAGCGPFATLLLPLLSKFSVGALNLHFLDIHQRSLDSVECLLTHFGYSSGAVQLIQGDACTYQHTGRLHLVVAETMQKSLEQEPQFAVTANLASQLHTSGVFIPQRIEVELCLCNLAREEAVQGQNKRHSLAMLCTLSAETAFEAIQQAKASANNGAPQLEPITVVIPTLPDIAQLDAALFTRICVFEQYCLRDYEAQITLPLKCHEMLPLAGGEQYQVSYQLGSYPKFMFSKVIENQSGSKG
ncbi:MAG: hypothetical protein AB8C02_12830 [Halioglobus sp.]